MGTAHPNSDLIDIGAVFELEPESATESLDRIEAGSLGWFKLVKQSASVSPPRVASEPLVEAGTDPSSLITPSVQVIRTLPR